MRYIELSESITAYHGSSNEHQGFDTKHTGDNSHTFGSYNTDRHGIFFSLNPKFAAMYGDVIQYELNINNTTNLDKSLDIVAAFADQTTDRGIRMDAQNVLYKHWSVWQLFEDDLGKEFVTFLKDQGYDSATFTEYNENDDGKEIDGKTIVVFNPSKVIKHGQLELDLYENTDEFSSLTIEEFMLYIENKYDVKQFFVSNYKTNIIKLDNIIVGDKKRGTGTEIMNDLITYADDNHKMIILTPAVADDRHGTTSRSRLVKFYKRFGFYENKGRKKDFSLPSGMIRDPQ